MTGEEPGSFFRRTGSDASHMNAYGVPCIIYGPGGRNHPDLKSMDVAGEHCSVENLVMAAKVYLDTALTIPTQAAQRLKISQVGARPFRIAKDRNTADCCSAAVSIAGHGAVVLGIDRGAASIALAIFQAS